MTGDPHFMITSRANGARLCFDADGSEGQVMKLIADEEAGESAIIQGRIFLSFLA